MAKCTRYKNRDTVSTFKISPSKVCEYTLPHRTPSTGYHELGKTLGYRHVLYSPNFYLMLNQTVPITTTTIMILCWYVLPLICELPNQLDTNFHSAISTEDKIRLWKDLVGHYHTDETQDSHDNAVDNGNDMRTAVLSLLTLSMSLEETRQHVCRIHRTTTVHVCLPSAIYDRNWFWISCFGPFILFPPKDF